MRDAKTMEGRGVVLTTTNLALEVVGRPKDLQQIDAAIKAETRKAEAARLALA